jgi:hypothetical protein
MPLAWMWAAVGWFFVWNSLTWIPSVYPAVNLYLVSHPVKLGRGVPSLQLILDKQILIVTIEEEFINFLG